MGFTPRMKQILKYMLEEDKIISIQNLAKKIGVSRRTVQRELEYMNNDLKPYNISMASKTGKGIWLEGTKEDKENLKKEVMSGDMFDVTNIEERRKRLILEILKEKGLKKLFWYSSKFKVSEATISGDLEEVEKWLKKYDLRVIRKHGSGVEVEGSEEDYRRAIRAFIRENIDTKLLKDAYEHGNEFSIRYHKLQNSNICNILKDDVLKRVISCVMGIDDERIKNLTENSYIGLIIHITIAINRIFKDEFIEEDTEWINKFEKDEDYLLSSRIVRELEEEFDIEIPPIEISYICLHIKAAKHEKIEIEGKDVLCMKNRELRKLVNEMIDAFDEKNAIYLKQDEEFIQGILAHLQPTFIRITHNMQISNPVLDDIKNDYFEIYERCKNVAKVIEKAIGKPVPEEEIGYITVHFGAAMVRLESQKEDIRQVSVGVICSSGIGISRLMSSKLKKIFGNRIELSTYGKKDITEYTEAKHDFFISSIPVEESNASIIFVSPLLSEKDIENIRRMLFKYERIPDKKIENKDNFSIQLENVNVLATQINAILKYMEFIRVNEDINFEELLIAISEKLSPYRDFVDMICEDIKKREQISTQIFAEFGFALFHTRTKGVIRPSFSICMTRNLGKFTDAYFKGIKTIFIMLVPIDENININTEILGYISSILIEDEEFLNIVSLGDKEKIRKALSIRLKKYFTKYIGKM